MFYVDARGRLLDELERFVAERTPAGRDPGLPAPAIVARHVLETVTWFARHRHHDPLLTLDDETARRDAVALVATTLGARPR